MIAASSDGKILAILTDAVRFERLPARIEIRDALTGKKTEFSTSLDSITDLALSADGTSLAIAGGAKVEIRSTIDGTVRQTLAITPAQTGPLTFAPDGKSVAVGTGDSIELWNIANAKREAVLTGHHAFVRCLKFSPDGLTLASGANDGTVRLWDTHKRTSRRTLQAHEGTVHCVIFSTDGKILATSGGLNDVIHNVGLKLGDEQAQDLGSSRVMKLDNCIRLWDSTSGAELRTLKGPARSIAGIGFGASPRTIISMDEDGVLRVWDAATGDEQRRLTAHATVHSPLMHYGRDKSLAVVANRGTIITVGKDRKDASQLKWWDIDAIPNTAREPAQHEPIDNYSDALTFAAIRKTLTGRSTYLNCAAFSPDGRVLASAGSHRSVLLWDTATGEEITAIQGLETSVDSMAFSSDGNLLALASKNSIGLWDTRKQTLIRSFTTPNELAGRLAFSGDGTKLVFGGLKMLVRDVTTGRLVKTLQEGPPGSDFVLLPDGKTIAVATQQTVVQFRDIVSGQAARPPLKFEREVSTLTATPDAKVFAVVDQHGEFPSGSCRLILYDAANEKVRQVLGEVKAGLGFSASFSPDGRLLASGHVPRKLQLWDVETGRELWRCPSYLEAGTEVAFSPDGKTLATWSGFPARIALLDVAQLLDRKLQRAAGHVEYVGGYVDSHSDPVKVRLPIRGRMSREALAGLQELTRPVELALEDRGNLSEDLLSSLGNMPSLTVLDLAGANRTSDEGVGYLSRVSGLKGLVLRGLPLVTDKSVDVFLRLPLTHLDLSGTGLTEAGVKRLRGLPNLRSLHLANLPATEATMTELSHLVHLTELTLTNLPGDAAAAHLRRLTGLRRLAIGSSQITDKGLEVLDYLQRLVELNLSNTAIADNGLIHLRGLTDLETLDLSGTEVTGSGFGHLAGLHKLSQLRLDRVETLTGQGFEHFKEMKKLTRLNLQKTGITNAGLAHLADLQQLRILVLPPHISAAGLAHLSKLTNLRDLDLSGLEKRWPSAREEAAAGTGLHLDLSRTSFTDKDLTVLHDWQHLAAIAPAQSRHKDSLGC
jgi:WD40 repeat protein/Leucine-rich repeat (LRR) protein